MTTRRRPAAWDDERLDAAFAARAERAPATPPDLPVAVRDRLEAAPQSSASGIRRLAPSLGLAAAVVVAVALGAGQLARSDPAASSSAGPPDAATLLGSPVNVRRAIEIRDANADDREIAVTGFLARFTTPMGCPADLRPLNPARLGCPASFVWLLDAPEVLQTTSGNTTTGHPPTGRFIQPSFDVSGFPELDGGAVGPTPMTLIGHFDDRRAFLCEVAERAACRDTFVVDRVAAVGGVVEPVWTTSEAPPPRSSTETVDRAVASAAPAAAILSRHVIGDGRLVDIEPALVGDLFWTGQRAVWLVTVVERANDRVGTRTFLIADGTTTVFEMTSGGPVRLTKLEAASSAAPPATGADILVKDLLAHPITVGEALDHRDLALDDTELAVEGFGWTFNGVLDCAVGEAGPRFLTSCVNGVTWLAPTDETHNDQGFLRPVGAGLNLAIQPETIGGIATNPTAVIVLGHFDDHRATTCPPDRVASCRRTFAVDAVVSPANPQVDGSQPGRGPDSDARPMSARDVALGWMGLSATDPRLIVAFAVRTSQLGDVEPAAVGAAPFNGVDTVWVARWVERGPDGRPVLRTRIVSDQATNSRPPRAYDVTAAGLVPVRLPTDPAPTPRSTADLPPGAPTEVLGLPVVSLSDALDPGVLPGVEPGSDMEIAIGGWFLQPTGSIDCPPEAGSPGPIQLACPTGFRWLTEEPQRLPIGLKGQFEGSPRLPAIHPVIGPEVPFEVPNLWYDVTADPLPVVVVGHFADRRSGAFDEYQRFVVDALVWRAGEAAPQLPVIGRRAPIETAEAVLARVTGVLGAADAAWLAAVPTADLAAIDPAAATTTEELTRPDGVVWIVRRLTIDHAGHPVVRSAFSLDGSSRVWADPDGQSISLASSLDVPAGASDLGQVTVEVKDVGDMLAGARQPTAEEIDNADWIERTSRDQNSIQVANAAGHPEAVLVRWVGGRCDRTWRLWVSRASTDGAAIQLVAGDLAELCRLVGITRTVVLEFREPVDASTVFPVPLSAGG